MKLQDLQNSLNSITSLEIHKLTGKNHNHVLRDIDVLNETYIKISLSKVGESAKSYSSKEHIGTRPEARTKAIEKANELYNKK